MQKFIIMRAIEFLAGILLSANVFGRIKGVVERWADKEVSNAEKKAGVKSELVVIGVQLSESLTNLAIELAVSFLKAKSGKIKPPAGE